LKIQAESHFLLRLAARGRVVGESAGDGHGKSRIEATAIRLLQHADRGAHAVTAASSRGLIGDRVPRPHGRSAAQCQYPFYDKGQGGRAVPAIYLWWFPFFCAAEKPEKYRDLCKNCSKVASWTLG
jgi:hypothetical protein